MAAGDQFEDVEAVYAAAYKWLGGGRPPRQPQDLLELADRVQPLADGLILDLGAYAGGWAAALAGRYGGAAIAVDIAAGPLKQARQRGVLALNADLTRLPILDQTVDLVWCRDTLSMVHDVDMAMVEIARVLKPGAGGLLYIATTTERLEPLERLELVAALESPSWWGQGRQPIDLAIATAGLRVLHEERVSPEHQEAALLNRGQELLDDLALLARLERDPAGLESIVGPLWSTRIRAWGRWPLYLLLGKLKTHLWVIQRPPM